MNKVLSEKWPDLRLAACNTGMRMTTLSSLHRSDADRSSQEKAGRMEASVA